MNVIKVVTTFLYFTFPIIIFAQYGVGSTEEVKKIKKTETLFTLITGHDEFNDALKEAVEKYWTFTPYRFISQEELKAHPGGSGFSYVELYNLSIDSKPGPHATGDFFNLGLFMSHKKKLRRESTEMEKFNSIAAVNLMNNKYWEYSIQRTEEDEAKEKKKWFPISLFAGKTASWRYARFFEALDRNGATKAELIKAIQLLNNYCHNADKMDFADNNPRPLIKAYNKEKGQIKKKTLLIANEDVSTKKKNNTQALKGVYKYDMKFVDQAEIWKAIEEQREDVCYAVIYYEERNMKIKAIIQAKDSKVLYGEICKLRNGLFTVSKETLESIIE